MADTSSSPTGARTNPSLSEPVEGNGWLLPAVGAVVLMLLWAAYLIPDVTGILSSVSAR